MLRIFACLSLLVCSAPALEEKTECTHECEKARLMDVVLNAKLDPSTLPTAIETLEAAAENGPLIWSAQTLLSELRMWANFYNHDAPKTWPTVEQSRPNMVHVDGDGMCTAFFGGFAYQVGSQWGRSGWFITEITGEDMEIEHRGYHDTPGTYERKRVTFTQPFIKSFLVGPDGFTRWPSIPPRDWKDYAENWGKP